MADPAKPNRWRRAWEAFGTSWFAFIAAHPIWSFATVATTAAAAAISLEWGYPTRALLLALPTVALWVTCFRFGGVGVR